MIKRFFVWRSYRQLAAYLHSKTDKYDGLDWQAISTMPADDFACLARSLKIEHQYFLQRNF